MSVRDGRLSVLGYRSGVRGYFDGWLGMFSVRNFSNRWFRYRKCSVGHRVGDSQDTHEG